MQDSYRELFFSESQEYLNIINNCLLKLEENPQDLNSLNEIFRCMHTLKGMSATMGYDKLAQLSHQMEDLLDELRTKKKKLTTEIIDILFSSVDTLDKLLDEIKNKQESKIDIAEHLRNLKRITEASPEDYVVPKAVSPDFSHSDLSVEEMDKVAEFKGKNLNVFKVKVNLIKNCAMKEARAFLLIINLKRIGEVIKTIPSLEHLKEGEFGEFFEVILASKEDRKIIKEEVMDNTDVESVDVDLMDVAQKAPSVVAASSSSSSVSAPQQQPSTTTAYLTKKIQSMRIPVGRLDKIMNLMGELAIAKIRLVQVVHNYKIDTLEEISFTLDRLTSALQDEIIQTRLLPVAYILDNFPRMVRDLSKKQGKDINLEILGSEIELDRVVLDEIGDPLIHLIRNAVDHGIESPEERKRKNKNPQGKLQIIVTRQKGQIFIEVVDDGKGVDFEAVRRVAIKRGVVTEKDAADIDEKRILDLIASPGFSTAEKITDVSGRGVGLDVVKSKIEALGGRMDFETKMGQGSRFILTLPLTLAIIKAMLVRIREEVFAVPLMNIRETIKIEESEIKIVQNFEVTRVRDEIIPIIRLDKNLAIPEGRQHKSDEDTRKSVVIVEHGRRVLGLIVSQVLGEQDIVVKPLGSLVKRTKGIAGATILGDGRVALILDTMSLV